MIVWINGAHGSGKTTTSRFLPALLPDTRVLDAANPGDAPNLIASYGTNGELGYVKALDLPATDPGSSTGQRFSRLLYANDGQTVKGEFTIN